MSIEKDNSTFHGVVEKDGKIVCEKCYGSKATSIMHLDGKDFFENHYQCECGNTISIRTKRTGEDAMYWEDDEQ